MRSTWCGQQNLHVSALMNVGETPKVGTCVVYRVEFRDSIWRIICLSLQGIASVLYMSWCQGWSSVVFFGNMFEYWQWSNILVKWQPHSFLPRFSTSSNHHDAKRGNQLFLSVLGEDSHYRQTSTLKLDHNEPSELVGTPAWSCSLNAYWSPRVHLTFFCCNQ